MNRPPSPKRSTPKPLPRAVVRTALMLLGVAALWFWIGWIDQSLGRTSYATGYLLFGVIFTLAAYNVRKRLPGLPLGSSANWLQLHIYLGIGSAALVLLHSGAKWPTGWLETVLAGSYWATFASGLWGLYLTRTLPKQLARTSEQYIYERIPILRREILDQSRTAVLSAAGDRGATTLAEFYCTRLDSYLSEPRGGLYAIRPTSTLRRQLMRELSDLRRFLSQAELKASEVLFALVRKKDDLDFHESRQGLLKRWLFVHITLTCVLLTSAVLHGWLALAMRGGVQ